MPAYLSEVNAQEDTLAVRLDDPDTRNLPLIQALVAASASVRYVEPIEHSLDAVYMQLVSEEGVTPHEMHHVR